MKYFKKDIKNEPKSLRVYRNTTPNPVYDGGNFDQKALKTALLKEQGYICAYCMGSISLDLNDVFKPKTEVEHYLSRQENKDLELKYLNMLVVCNGFSISHPEQEEIHHCDKTKGLEGKMNGFVQLRKLDPRTPECEKLIRYTKFGEILATNGDDDVKHDLEKVLNLNNKILITARRNVVEITKNALIQEKPIQQWNKAFLQKHLDKWQSLEKGKFRRYCMIAVWFLKNLIDNPKYNR